MSNHIQGHGWLALYSLPQDPFINMEGILWFDADTKVGYIAHDGIYPATEYIRDGAEFVRYINYPVYPPETQKAIMDEVRVQGQARQEE